MLYDNGGRGAPLPMAQQMPLAQKPVVSRPMPLLANGRKRLPFQSPVTYQPPINSLDPYQGFNLQGSGGGNVSTMTQETPQQRPVSGYATPTPNGQQPVLKAMTARRGRSRLQQLYARDINGRTPGMFGYIPPAAPAPRANMVPYGYQPPQYQGNPFMPAVLK